MSRLHSRLRAYWEEAAAATPLLSDDPDDQAHEIAKAAVAIMRERRVMRPLVGFIRRDVERMTPLANRDERRAAVQTSLIYRVLDIARPGSLSEEERMLAITGRDSGDTRDVTPIPPSDIARVAATLTVREAAAIRSWLFAAWESGVIPVRPDTSVLDDVLLELTALRLGEDREHLEQALPLAMINSINAKAAAIEAELDDGFVPGQMSLEDASEYANTEDFW